MQKYKVSFRSRALTDLLGLHRYIASEGGLDAAGEYIDRLEAACMALATFPRRGARRDDIRPGLRTIGFERRAVIAFQVSKLEVIIVRIFYGGRDFEQILRSAGRRSVKGRP